MAEIEKHISNEERQKLYKIALTKLGAPIRKVELTEDMMDVNFLTALEDYAVYVNEWLTEQQWGSLQNLDLSSEDVTLAYITKTLNFEKSFTHAYSKQVGLGANGPSHWELKKDYITVEENTQVYTIPANREVNQVLWYTPPQIGVTRFASPMGDDATSWVAGAQGWNIMGAPGQHMLPAFTMLLSAQDRTLKRSMMGSELTYRITPGPAGTKNLYLYPIPGSDAEIKGLKSKHYAGAKVWYFYYDTNLGDPAELTDYTDIIKMPGDVPLETIKWSELNSASRTHVRNLFIASCKINLGDVRGKFSGVVQAGDLQLTLDYRSLKEDGIREMEMTFTKIKENLEKLSLVNQMEQRANIAENLNRVLSKMPNRVGFIWK